MGKKRGGKLFVYLGAIIVLSAMVVAIGGNKNSSSPNTSNTTMANPFEHSESAVAENSRQVDAFIARFNAVSDNPIENGIVFDPQDKKGEHYRTEYRLGAFVNASGTFAAFDDWSIDVVSYRDGIRIYVSSSDLDLILNALRSAVSAYEVDVLSADVEEVIDKIKLNGELSHYDLNGISMYVLKKSTGYELFMDR